MSRNYKTVSREQIEQWAAHAETSDVVAAAIHAISDDKRTPDAIWQDPTDAEMDHVRMAVEEYITHGDYEPSEDGVYHWGAETITVPAHTIE